MTGRGVQWAVSRGLLVGFCLCWPACAVSRERVQSPDDAQTAQGADEQGNAVAQYNLGVRYEAGRGVPQDDEAAVRWFRRAAEQGHAGAQNNLGVMYTFGRGVPQDDVMAYMWANLAAAQSSDVREDVVKLRDRLAARMTPEQVAQAQGLAWKGKPKLEQ